MLGRPHCSYLLMPVLNLCPNCCLCWTLPELKGEEEWTRCGYWKSFPLTRESVLDNCERVSYLEVDQAGFIERFERPGLPVVITDSQLDWQANRKWTVEVTSFMTHPM